MGYRDDRDAMQSRIDELEGELSQARETIARLRGDGVTQVPDAELDRLTGIPKFLHLVHELPFELTDEGKLAIVRLLDARIPGGTVTQVGDTLTHRKASYELRASTHGGRTRLELKGDYRPARQQLLLGSPGLSIIGGVLFGAIAAATAGGAMFTALGALCGIIGGFVLLRALLQHGLTRDRRTLVGAFEGVVELANAHSKPADRHRIDVARGGAASQAPDEEAAAELDGFAAPERALRGADS